MKKIFIIPCLFFAVYCLPASAAFITPDQLAEKMKREPGKVTIVDIQIPEQFNRAHIAGALNMRSHEVRHKNFLKKKGLILAYNGIDPCSTLALAENLKKSGFRSVDVLAGGMQEWILQSYPLQGTGWRQQDKLLVPVRGLLQALKCEHMEPMLIDIQTGSKIEIPGISFTGRLPFENRSAEVFASVIKKLRPPAEDSDAWKRPVVLIDAAGQQVQHVVRMLRRDGMHRVYGLEGGCRGWQDYMKIKKSQKNILKKKKCPTCPK